MYTDDKGKVPGGEADAAASETERAADLIFAALVDRIIAGELRPGDALNETALAESFAVSRTPVREALQRLGVTGLAQRGPRRAFMVSQPDRASLDDLFEAMGEVEALCAEYAARRMSAAERAGLAEIVAEGAERVAATDEAGYIAVNARFHRALFDGAHNATLRDLALGLRIRTSPYRDAQFRRTERLASSQAEHQRILTAVRAENPAAAGAAVREHIAATALNIARMIAAARG